MNKIPASNDYVLTGIGVQILNNHVIQVFPLYLRASVSPW